MKTAPTPAPEILNKSRTEISGFAAMTGGGMPRGRSTRGRSTLLTGGPGSGKTIGATMLGGGHDRGASVLINGFRGKTG